MTAWPAASDTEPECIDLAEDFDEHLLQQVYTDIYQPAFPIRDEQEDPTIWTPRLRDPHANPHLCFLVLGQHLRDRERRKPQGMLLAEYYAASQCVLISYVAVDETQRGKGLARKLFDALQQRLHLWQQSGSRPVVAVLAEIHDPALTPATRDVLPPLARLEVMARLGGKRIPVDYLQPPLSQTQLAAGGLWLIAFPDRVMPARAPTVAQIRQFLLEFYRELGSPDPEQDPVYTDTFASLNTLSEGTIALEPMVVVASTLRLHQAAVALQYAVTGSIEPDAKCCLPHVPYCTHYHSYEKDLLSHAFRNPPPVRSSCVPNIQRPDGDPACSEDYFLEAKLHLPMRLRFITEGETLERYRRGELVLPVKLSFSRSDFLQSDRTIFNLVVHIDTRASGEIFGEYELLCLSKQWSAADDSEVWLHTQEIEDVRFEMMDSNPPRFMRLNQLASHYLKLKPEAAPVGGCVQIVFCEKDACPDICALDTEQEPILSQELINALNTLQQENTAPPDRLHPALNAVGCLLQNILDLENVDLNELEDMLDGVNTSRSAVTAIHRNTLFALTVNDRLFDDLACTIGMSPYLLLPQAALLHNEGILLDASALLRQIDEVTEALDDTEECDVIRRRLVEGVRHEKFDDLPGGPDHLIRWVVRWLWKRHYRSRKLKPRRRWRDVNVFAAELDLAIREGLAAHARTRLSTLLDRDTLGNIFQYVSERWIFEEGQRDRGLDSLLGVLRKRMQDLDTMLESAETRQSDWRNSNYTVIGLVFTLYTVIPFEGTLKRFEKLKAGDDLNWAGILLLVGVGLALVTSLLWRRIIVLIYLPALGHVASKLGPRPLLGLKPDTPHPSAARKTRKPLKAD